MLITNHWSASPPVRLNAYHIEFAATEDLDATLLHDLRAFKDNGGNAFANVPWSTLLLEFTIWKNDSFTTQTDYGTWDENTDPRDGSPNIEIAAMCMVGATTTNWGSYPYTIAHAWMHAGIIARICALKDLDANGSFDTSVEPSVLQNGPIYVVSTHGERALQTRDYGVAGGAAQSQELSDEFGYFVGSGDPDSRWDIALLDPQYISFSISPANAKASAAWLREQAHLIKSAGITDYWGLDK